MFHECFTVGGSNVPPTFLFFEVPPRKSAYPLFPALPTPLALKRTRKTHREPQKSNLHAAKISID